MNEGILNIFFSVLKMPGALELSRRSSFKILSDAGHACLYSAFKRANKAPRQLFLYLILATLVSWHCPTQSVMYVPLQVNRFAESILLIVQYRYLKSFVLAVYNFRRGISAGPDLKYFALFIREGGSHWQKTEGCLVQ